MEHAQTEDKSLEFWFFMALCLVIVRLRELAERAAQVSLEVLRGFVGHLNGVLKDRLRNDFHVWKARGLRRNEASELRVAIVFNDDFKFALEILHPVRHQVHVLDHDPVTIFGGVLQRINGFLFLTLTHRNVGEGSFLYRFTQTLAYIFDSGGGVNTREEYEEDWNPHRHNFVNLIHIESWLLYISVR